MGTGPEPARRVAFEECPAAAEEAGGGDESPRERSPRRRRSLAGSPTPSDEGFVSADDGDDDDGDDDDHDEGRLGLERGIYGEDVTGDPGDVDDDHHDRGHDDDGDDDEGEGGFHDKSGGGDATAARTATAESFEVVFSVTLLDATVELLNLEAGAARLEALAAGVLAVHPWQVWQETEGVAGGEAAPVGPWKAHRSACGLGMSSSAKKVTAFLPSMRTTF
jgi:hypothetical protein